MLSVRRLNGLIKAWIKKSAARNIATYVRRK
jgi:hypothetical protein